MNKHGTCVYIWQVQAFIALGPVATVGHIEGFAKYLSDAVVEEEVRITSAVIVCFVDFYTEGLGDDDNTSDDDN